MREIDRSSLPIRIRRVTGLDITTCAEIFATVFSAPPYDEEWTVEAADTRLRALCRHDPDHCFVAEISGRVVAFAFAETDDLTFAFLHEVAVAPEWQGSGIGTRLMEFLCDCLRGEGISALEITVDTRAQAYAFYHKLGFREPQEYVLMVKRL